MKHWKKERSGVNDDHVTCNVVVAMRQPVCTSDVSHSVTAIVTSGAKESIVTVVVAGFEILPASSLAKNESVVVPCGRVSGSSHVPSGSPVDVVVAISSEKSVEIVVDACAVPVKVIVLLVKTVLVAEGERIIGGVKISVVQALHSNGVSTKYLTNKEKSELAADALTAYVGPDNGYVLTFTNGLVVYISGDTGPTSDMATVVRDFYGAEVAVIHLASPASNTPEAGAFAVNRLIKPRTAIVEHANSSSSPGSLASNVADFIDAVSSSINVIVPFSFGTNATDFIISCDGNGVCTQTLP